ncbi:endonuclease domain-containing 1 protein-like [Mytilus californianus]|uniref:endonuclease domain-containing 1 protein-like n=1 Tax=Mytilus californianus TaxID=6549 RepID=UPI0022453093|nr:endonuclease domain-containing 1 protein-like [Mytilus californianus]XP_052080474.1 endonuclease domain-containing 1 protein-like [Mytilus californianus]
MLPGILVCFAVFESTYAIVSESFQDCRQFFYQRKPPQVFTRMATEKYLCEIYNGRPYFATFYDTLRKIPVYSAYKVEHFHRPNNEEGKRKWRKGEGLQTKDQPFLINYNGVQLHNLNRGHLAPRFYFPTNEGRTATDVLTNIAPQYALFNQLTWFSLEKYIYEASKHHCNYYGGTSYFVTGVLPSDNVPLNGKINIPSHFWTAVCCDTSSVSNLNNRLKGWSFAYIGENQNTRNNFIEFFTVKDFMMIRGIRGKFFELFQDIISFDYHTMKSRIVHKCLFDSDKADQIIAGIVIDINHDRFHYNGQAPEFLL